MSEPKRIYQIDLFRFIAAFAVVLYHYLYRGYAAGNMSLLRFDGVGEYFRYGYLGVDLFFIISGFVIAFSIKHLSLRKFFNSRFKRLYPIFGFVCSRPSVYLISSVLHVIRSHLLSSWPI